MKNSVEYDDIINSPVGFLGVKFTGEHLSKLEFLGKNSSKYHQKEKYCNKNKEIISSLKVILNQYFKNAVGVTQPATLLNGTDFQKKVWHELSRIAVGETRTYGDIANQLKTSPRAVGNACRRNPVPIFIPCHRVVSQSGRGGFMGHTKGEPMAIKDWLLAHEQKKL